MGDETISTAIGAVTPWHRRRRRGDRQFDEGELSMLAVDPGWSDSDTMPRRRVGRRNPTQQQDALDHAVSEATGRLLQVMEELDLDPSTGVLTGPAFPRQSDRQAMLHMRIGNLDESAARYGADAAGVRLAHLAQLLQILPRDDGPVGRPAEEALAATMIHATAATARDRLRMVRHRAGRHRCRHGNAVIPIRLFGSVVPVPADMTTTSVLDNCAALTRTTDDENTKP